MPKPRQTKIGTVEAMLRQPGGTNVMALCEATGWQPHTVRAALSGLRRAGFTITRTRGAEMGDPTTFRITADPEQWFWVHRRWKVGARRG